MAKPKKQFAVIGLGSFGTSITKSLHALSAEVLVIDNDQEKINSISQYCSQAVCADAEDENVLEKLGINNFDTVIISTGDDVAASIFITATCKQLQVPEIIAKAQDARHKQVLEKIGADRVIIPEEECGEKLASMLAKPNMIEIMSLTDNFRIVEIRTPPKWQNKTLIQLDLRKTEKVSIILIKRDEEVIVTPSADCILEANDILVIVGTIADTKRLSSKATQNV